MTDGEARLTHELSSDEAAGPLRIRQATWEDADALWPILHAVFSAGETYPQDPATPRDEALAFWLSPPLRSYVAERDGRIVGTYYLKPNQPTLGAHVANAGYMVAPQARGRGIGRAIAEHSLAEARRLGYRAMQFNLVVKTNVASYELSKKLGFTTIGTIPEAFRHREHGYVDAYVMYRKL